MTNIQQFDKNVKRQAKDAYVEYLDTIDWTYFITGTTRYELTMRSARRLSHRWFNDVRSPGDESMFFWVSEPFELKDGHHIHGLLKVPTQMPYSALQDTWQRSAGNHITENRDGVLKWDLEKWSSMHLRKYKKGVGAHGYCAKYIMKNRSDYDLLI